MTLIRILWREFWIFSVQKEKIQIFVLLRIEQKRERKLRWVHDQEHVTWF